MSSFSVCDRIKAKKREKLKKKEEANKKNYDKNKAYICQKMKESYSKARHVEYADDETLRKRLYRQKVKDDINQKRNKAEAKRTYRKRMNQVRNDQAEHENTCTTNNINDFNAKTVFSSRTKKFRAMKRLKASLPATPRKRAVVLSSYLQSKNSPTVNYLQGLKIIPSETFTESVTMAESILGDMKEVINNTKHKRTDDARATVNIMSAAINGDGAKKARCKMRLSRKLGLTPKRLSTGK